MKKYMFLMASTILVSCSNPTSYKPIVYNNCKVIKLERSQDYTNFNWQNNITFVCDSDTITGCMTSENICKLHEDLKSHKGLVTLKLENHLIKY